jgi:hypothetical protein
LENNCGNPVDLSIFPDIYREFKDMLTKEADTKRPRISKVFAEPSIVNIIIPNDWFYRYGCFIKYKNKVKLRLLIERKLKFQLMQYISQRLKTGKKLSHMTFVYQKTLGHMKLLKNILTGISTRRYNSRKGVPKEN